jgi:molybdopterin/thiamine biosynthesis adenylyltransferase
MGDEVDYFSRQRSVPDWHQPLLEGQTALVLGVGGIGCSVARNLCRLGVEEVILVDKDKVEASNLNRQVLFSTSDVRRRKVDAALDGLKPHCIRTKLTVVECDAVLEWGKIVELAKRSSVIFNGIDVGEYFDYAVSSLCAALCLPYLSASSYGHSAVVDCYPSPLWPGDGPCWACNNTPSDTHTLSQLTPQHITRLSSLSFLPKDSHMPATQDVGSSVVVATLAATLATGSWVNSLHGYRLPHWTACDFTSLSMSSFRVDRSPSCLICNQAPRYSPAVIDVYFGVERVCLSPVPGSALSLSATPSAHSKVESLREVVLKRLDPERCDSGWTAGIVLPALPATDPLVCEEGVDAGTLPDILHEPLLKTEEGTISAIVSGRRSAILATAQGCYRLKGCGCYLDKDGSRLPFPAFPVEEIEGTEGKRSEVKGCCFKHTAHNEQVMCDVVTTALGAADLVPVGNKPLCVWSYSIPEDLIATIPKYCGVFETLGEKRLSSDLLPGLASLLPHLLPSSTLPSPPTLFPAHRVSHTEDGVPVVRPTWSACCCGQEKQQEPVNMCHTPLLETPPTFHPEGLSPRLLGEWCRTLFVLRDFFPLSRADLASHGSVLAELYWRLGWEVGMVSQTLSTNGINWGYFIDHNPFEPHCNQHPNNLIVLPPVSIV